MALYQSDHDVRSAMIRSLQDWWCANAQDGLPDRAHFQPADFKHMLPFMLISDVEHTPFRIRYRLVGTRVVAATGLDVTGMYLDTLEPVGEEEPWMEDYALSYQNRRPVVGTTTTRTASGLRFEYEFGIFPLAKGGQRVEQFIGIEDYFEFAHLFHELEEWRVRV